MQAKAMKSLCANVSKRCDISAPIREIYAIKKRKGRW